MRGGEPAAGLHLQRELCQVQLKDLKRGSGAEGGIQLLGRCAWGGGHTLNIQASMEKHEEA